MNRRATLVGNDGDATRGLRPASVVVATGLLLAGCVSPPVMSPPASELQLLAAGMLEIPPGCEPVRGAVYRTAYVVQPDGRVAAIASESGSGCVQEALRQWVATFRYRPVDEPTATVLDWMGVVAARGG
jgi:hypothetical protein